MAASTPLLQFLLVLVAGWLHRQQAATIEYLQVENRMLRERLGGRRIIFTDAERRQLAEKARAHPNSEWMVQVGRNLLDVVDGSLRDKKYLLLDRDTKYCTEFRQMLTGEDVQVMRLPPRSPNLNAYAERFVRSIKESCLDRLILVGEASLRKSVREFVEHYHLERNHQGLDNQLILPVVAPTPGHGRIVRRERLGGLLKYYHREAA